MVSVPGIFRVRPRSSLMETRGRASGSLDFDDDLGGKSGDLIQLLLHGHPFDDVPEFDPPGGLGQDGNGVGVPLGDQVPALDGLAVFHLDLGPVNDRIPLPFPAVLIHDGQFPVAVHDHQISVFVPDRGEVDELHPPVVPGLEGRSAPPGGWPYRRYGRYAWSAGCPGSPMDWAAMMPTASPMLTSLPRARSRP